MKDNKRQIKRFVFLCAALAVSFSVSAKAKEEKQPQQKRIVKAAKKDSVKKEMVCKTDGMIYVRKNSALQIKQKTIRTKKQFKNFQMMLKKKKEKAFGKVLKKKYAGTNFQKKSIVLVPQLFSPYMNYKYSRMITKFDAKGKLVGEIQIKRNEKIIEPGVSYPAIVKLYVIAIQVPKAQEAMIDYYRGVFED